MKLHCHLLCFFLLFVSGLNAQDYIGLRGGGNISNTPLRIQSDSTTILDQKTLSFFLVGIDFEKVLNKNFSLISGLDLSKEGSILVKRYNDGSDIFYHSNEIRYLKLSVLPKFNVHIIDYTLYGIVGPSFSYALDGQSSIYDENNFENRIVDLDLEEVGIKRFDLGLIGGVGIEKVVAKNVKVSLGIRYYLGLVNISEIQELDVFNESMSVFIGAALPFGKK